MSDKTMGAAGALDRLRRATAALAAHETKRADLLAKRDAAMVAARECGVTPKIIAEVTGVSAGRVSQVAPKVRSSEPAPARRGALVDVPLTSVPHVPAGPVMSGHATKRHEGHYGARVSAWVDLSAGRGITAHGTVFVLGGYTLADTLRAIPDVVARVYVTRDWHGVPRDGETHIGSVRSWGLAGAEGWEPRGHWTATDEPVFRWLNTATGREVEVLSSLGWFGAEAGPDECADAWASLSAVVAGIFPGGVLLSTPATTGRDLWQRTIGHRVEYPTLAGPIRDLIAETSGQGRTEVLPGRGTVDGFTYMDGRFMYAALMHGMPVGEAHHVIASQPAGGGITDGDAALLNKRGRWRATVTVPAGWRHVGILGRQGMAGWDYPSTPGETWETWADAAEVRLALAHGWGVELHEGILWEREGKPLTAWRDALVAAWDSATDPLVRGALRAIVLFGLGGFAARRPTREGWADSPEDVPEGARSVWRDGARWRYVVPVEASAWQEAMAHPEWPATVWARARVALLEHRLSDGTKGGALHVPAGAVMGFRTDAIYLAGPAPEWADDGRPGRFRVKGQITEPVTWPADGAALLALRERSEA